MTNIELNANLKQLFNIFVFHCNKFNKCVLCHKGESYYVDILCKNCLEEVHYKNTEHKNGWPQSDLADFLNNFCVLCDSKREKPSLLCEKCSKKYSKKRKEK